METTEKDGVPPSPLDSFWLKISPRPIWTALPDGYSSGEQGKDKVGTLGTPPSSFFDYGADKTQQ
ncbi:MAG: hypothetical protein PHE17_18390 [Thiothrix sp.]|uniref:hypothetical protein n=1 Tax=Thiothrix sp. TaxID=1032 RepID=UPI0026221A0C|nr:hypothetical protein [Thiothrix sp.]MDD5394992.1 hypothetical protein [Thiothrix sp.]